MNVKTLFTFLGVLNLLFGRTSFSGMLKVVMSESPFRDQPYDWAAALAHLRAGWKQPEVLTCTSQAAAGQLSFLKVAIASQAMLLQTVPASTHMLIRPEDNATRS